MFGVVRFWLERGVDGFRLDAINWLGKDTSWPDNPRRLAWRSYYRQVHRYDRDQPQAHETLRALWVAVKNYPDTMLVGEASSDTPGGPAAFYGSGTNELHEVFDFRLLRSPWQADVFRRLILESDRAVPGGGWPPIVFSNHDQSRHIDRYGKDGDPVRRARAAALLLFTLRGTPFVYYGEELGLRDGRLRRSDLRDPYTIRYWPWKKGAIRRERRCRGILLRMPDSQPAHPGCRSRLIGDGPMSSRDSGIPDRCCRSISGSFE